MKITVINAHLLPRNSFKTCSIVCTGPYTLVRGYGPFRKNCPDLLLEYVAVSNGFLFPRCYENKQHRMREIHML